MTRQLPINGIRKIENEERTFILSFSSEEPYERFFGPEILDHGEGAADFTRLNEIGVLLFNHNYDKVVGRILRAEVKDGRGEAVVKFDDDEFSEVIYKKVESGTLKGVSVGYIVDNWEEVKKGQKSKDGRFEGPCFIALKWRAFEISIVSVPADATVGVGRSAENGTDFYNGPRDMSYFKNKINENIKNLHEGRRKRK